MGFECINLLTIISSTCLFFVTIFYIYAKYKLSYWSRKGVKSLPANIIFGHFKDTFTFQKAPGQVVQEIYEKADPNDPYLGFYIFHQPKLLLRDPNLMKQLFIKDFETFPNRCFGGDLEKDSVGLISLLSIHQPRWKYLRQKMTPSVTGHKLRGMVPLIKECGNPMLNFIENSKNQSDGWKELELKDISSRYATDVIASLAFGVTTNSFDEKNVAFWEAGQKILSGVKRGLILITLLYLPGLVKYIENFTAGPAKYFRYIFWDSFNTREKSGTKRGDLIDHFVNLKNGEQVPTYKFEGDNLLSQAVSFYVAGFEATSTIVAFSLFELSLHPEYEELLYKEIKETLNGKEIDADLLNQMTVLDQVVNETLRLHPPLPVLDRISVQDYKLPGTDIVLEKGTPIYVSINGTNRDPKFFEKPNEFIPTRPRMERDDLPSTSLTFGMGPRTCVECEVLYLIDEHFLLENKFKKTMPELALMHQSDCSRFLCVHNSTGQRLGLIITKMALVTILSEYTLTNEKTGETTLKPLTIFKSTTEGLHVKLKKRN